MEEGASAISAEMKAQHEERVKALEQELEEVMCVCVCVFEREREERVKVLEQDLEEVPRVRAYAELCCGRAYAGLIGCMCSLAFWRARA